VKNKSSMTILEKPDWMQDLGFAEGDIFTTAPTPWLPSESIAFVANFLTRLNSTSNSSRRLCGLTSYTTILLQRSHRAACGSPEARATVVKD
jgi:hypothetical protein